MHKNGPWLINKSKIVYKNPWIKVKVDSVTRPDGKNGIYSTVEISPGVFILPVDKDQKVVLIKSFQYALGRYDITVAGGKIENNENALAAAKRELKEEAGIISKKYIYMGDVDSLTSGIITSSNKMYLAMDIKEVKPTPDGTENIKPFKISLNDAVDKVMKGEITNPATALLILKANYLLTKNVLNNI